VDSAIPAYARPSSISKDGPGSAKRDPFIVWA
jgi:hypothetical protein